MSKEENKSGQEAKNSPGLRKSKYFEKYRNELEKISTKMRKPPSNSDTVLSNYTVRTPKESRLKTMFFTKQPDK